MTKRFERRPRRHIRLVKRDLEIVRAVFEARYLTNRQVCRLLFSPGTFSWCKQRLRYLFDLGYLGKRKAYANEPDIYYLGLQGRRHIARMDPRYSQAEVDRIAGVSGGPAGAPFLMMGHELALSDLYVNVRLETKAHGLDMRWRNSRMLELLRLPMQPDAFIYVSQGGGHQAAFIEFTGVLPTEVEMRRKLGAYEQYLELQRCRRDLEVARVSVLWLTNARAKQVRILRAIRRSAYRDWFLAGLVEDADYFITGRMWQWSESVEPIRWFRPQQQVVFDACQQGKGAMR